MGDKRREINHTPVIRFKTDDQIITVTFSQEESVGVKAVILDILTESYREHLQKVLPYDKA